MKKIALLGCGSHSLKYHAPSLAKYVSEHPGEIELTAVCDLDADKAENARNEFGFRNAYTDLETMLAKEKPDGCVCVMPIPVIATLGIVLLEKGMPCVIEKPLGATLDEVQRLTAVAEKNRTPHMVSVNRRFDPYYRQAVEWATARGPIRRIRASMLRHNRKEREFLWATGLHVMDAATAIAGGPDGTDHQVRTILSKEPSVPAWYQVSFDTKSGVPADVDILPTCGFNEEIYELYGEGYLSRIHMRYNHPTTVTHCSENRKIQEIVSPPDEPIWMTDGTFNETTTFIQALSGHTPWGPTIMDVAPIAELGFRNVVMP